MHNYRRLAAVLVALTAAGALLAACGADDPARGADPGTPLTIAAAASLRDAFRAYGEAEPGTERFSFAGSDQLAAQIRQGAPVDLYASADPRYARELAAEGLVAEPFVFARSELVLAVAANSPLETVEQVAEPGIDVVIGAPDVPAGEYAREAIARLEPPVARGIAADVRSEEPDVKGVVGKLAQGAADAGFVYVTDVLAAGDALRAIELPRGVAPPVEYAVAVASGATDPARARRFADGLLEGAGARALAEAGFGAPR